MKSFITFLLALSLAGQLAAQENRILVFSKTAAFRHASIEKGKQFFLNWARQSGTAVDTTENAAKFTDANLKRYRAVVFLSTTGDVLNPSQQVAFERYIQSGGGFVGIHAATDTEYDWPWYNRFIGAYFASHPGGSVSNVQNGRHIVLDGSHPSTQHLPTTFERKDEFYDFKNLQKDQLKFLVRVDEGSYQQGKMGDFHPLAWYQEFDGGRMFYTNYGHTDETFSEPLMMQHIIGGLTWAMASKLDYSKATSQQAPEENRFTKTNLVKNLDEPTELAVMPNGKVIFTERKGPVKVWNPLTKTTKTVAIMPVYSKFEYGVMGVGVDPNFEQNNWVYIYYTPETTEHKDNFLSRFTYDQQRDTLLWNTEKVVLRVPVKRVECCHTGGSIDWDKDGNLFLSTGDDTNPFDSDGYAPIDFREGRQGWDALSSSGNTNDLRGKILRIKPTPEGSYTIPRGNLFEGDASGKTRPEIFVMGCRNPYRISVDKQTGYLYWGDIGPDAGKADPKRGPDGQVEFNQARRAGNFGWPLFVGNNDAYNRYDFEKKQSGEKFDPEKPLNESPHNTGLRELPPTNRPLLWYGYGVSEKFPLFDKGGANPMAGPVFHTADYTKSSGTFPNYFENKFFTYEWMRDWIIAVSLDAQGNYVSMERFMPSTTFYHPMDMTFDKHGRMYLLEYGPKWFAQNEEAMLSVIDYNEGNRRPVAKIMPSVEAGATPLTVKFTGSNSVDYDGDALSYWWTFKGPDKTLKPLKTANPTVTFKKSGNYDVSLTVTDAAGNSHTEIQTIRVGNAVPLLDIAVAGNQSFYFDNEPITYEVKVNDKEDGTLQKGIAADDVPVSINYLEGYDKTLIEQGHKANSSFLVGKRHMDASDCKACHMMNEKSIGPSYQDISKKYPTNRESIDLLAGKIINGGGGVWGEQAMAAHPQLSKKEANEIVEYILNLKEKKPSEPVKAAYKTTLHKGKKDGTYLIQATYIDRGHAGVGSQTATKTLTLRSPKLLAYTADIQKGVSKFSVPPVGDIIVANHEGYIGFESLDLTDIKTIEVTLAGQAGQTAGGKVEVRLGSPTAPAVGSGELGKEAFKVISVPLATPAKGKQTVYLTFSNPGSEGKPLFAVTTVVFKK